MSIVSRAFSQTLSRTHRYGVSVCVDSKHTCIQAHNIIQQHQYHQQTYQYKPSSTSLSLRSNSTSSQFKERDDLWLKAPQSWIFPVNFSSSNNHQNTTSSHQINQSTVIVDKRTKRTPSLQLALETNKDIANNTTTVINNATNITEASSQTFPRMTSADWRELFKLRLSIGVAASAVPPAIWTLAIIGAPVGFSQLASVFAGVLGCSMSASIWNQLIEVKTDNKMHRTSIRPLPNARISQSAAATIGIISGIIGTSILYLGTNSLTAILGFSNILFYIFYTLSKRFTSWNTFLGAIVGAIPPAMGWSAVMADPLSILAQGHWQVPATFFMLQFLWQFPHFFSIAWLERQCYTNAGLVMLPNHDVNGTKTALSMAVTSAALLITPFVSWYYGVFNCPLTTVLTAINLAFVIHPVHQFCLNRNDMNARAVKKGSLIHTAAFFSIFILAGVAVQVYKYLNENKQDQDTKSQDNAVQS